MSHRIHQFEVSAARELFKRYNNVAPDVNVAYAIATELLERESQPAELLAALAAPLGFYQSLADQNALTAPDD